MIKSVDHSEWTGSSSSVTSSTTVHPEYLDQWFPTEQQRNYVSMLMGRVGLTRRRAEYFVRLWAYLLIKQQQELGKPSTQPLAQLYQPEGLVACTHREAAELFYGNKDRGSDRAAGMMIDRLAALGLIEKQFDGHTICIRIRSLPELTAPVQEVEPIEIQCDAFNPRTDAIPVANLLARNYTWMEKDTISIAPQKIARVLRSWAQQYSTGMRVLRRCDNMNPVGINVLFPVASESEANFFLAPAKSLYLTTSAEADPFKLAVPGDLNCSSIFVRAWMIDAPFMKRSHLHQFLEDGQRTLSEVQKDFPNLCDIYALAIHPIYETLLPALGFQKTSQDNLRLFYWAYQAVDHYLDLDINHAIANLKLELFPGKS